MEIRLSQNIRALRRERGLTQEQLAEALGVTVGAVSKWESGASTPELPLIVSMAGFFESSVDALLGYGWQEGGMGRAAERIRALRNEKRFDEATEELEQALQKYPNAFKIVFGGAVLCSMKGLEQEDSRAYLRALELFERSISLLPQNDDPSINEWYIRNRMAEVCTGLGQNEEALERLRKNNAGGLNDAAIGFILAAQLKRPDEALPYLSDALVSCMSQLFTLVIGMCNAFSQKEENQSALDILLWMRGIVAGLRQPDNISYYDREEAQLLSACAKTALQTGDANGAKRYLRQALELAKRFDAAPDYSFVNSRWFYGKSSSTGFDDFGGSTGAGIRENLITDETKEDADKLIAILEEIEKND